MFKNNFLKVLFALIFISISIFFGFNIFEAEAAQQSYASPMTVSAGVGSGTFSPGNTFVCNPTVVTLTSSPGTGYTSNKVMMYLYNGGGYHYDYTWNGSNGWNGIGSDGLGGAFVAGSVNGFSFTPNCPGVNKSWDGYIYFTPLSYSVTWNSATGGTSSGVGSCTYGTTVTPTCTPYTGYSVSGCSSFTCSTSNSFTPSFTPNSYSISYTATNGSVSPTTCTYGTTVTPVCTPNSGYVTGSCPAAFTCSTSNSKTATFNPGTYSISYTATNGSVSPTTCTYGTTVTPVCTPNANYFTSSCPGSFTCSTSNSKTATFTINSYNITYIAGTNGNITGSTTQAVNYGSSTTAVTAVPNTGYHFVNWSDGSTANPRTHSNVTAATSTTANFAINTYPLNITKTGTGSGTVTASPVGVNCGATCSYDYNYNTSITLTASSGAGSTFVGWSGGSCSGTSTCTFTLTATTTITANFGDGLPPSVETPIIYAGIVSDTYFEGTVSLSSHISDSGSGLKSNSCEVSINSGAWTTVGVTQDALYCYYNSYTPNGNFNLTFRVQDNASNIGTSSIVSFISNDTSGVANSLGIGGLVGYQNSGTISNSYSAGNVSGSHNVGGLVGYQRSGTVSNSYSNSPVTGSSFVGGLIGWQSNGTVLNTYSTGAVSASSTKGGLVGFSFGTIIGSFWDKVTSGVNTSAAGEGKTSTELQTANTFSSWSSAIWNILSNGYPVLRR